MVWVRIDDAIGDNPKIAAVGGLGLAVQVAGLAYCNRNLTDGFVPRNTVTGLVGWEVIDDDGRVWGGARTCGAMGDDLKTGWVVEQMVRVGLWHDQSTVNECERCDSRWPTTQTHGYLIHDFPDFQPSAEEVNDKREKNRLRVAKHRNTRSNGVANATSNATGNEAVTPLPVPVPVPQEQELQTLADSQAPRGSKYPPEFEEFWKSYPINEGKGAAFTAWKKARRRATHEAILEGCERYKAVLAQDPDRKVKWAQGWLNESRWEDDPAPARSGKTSKTQRLLALADRMEGDAT